MRFNAIIERVLLKISLIHSVTQKLRIKSMVMKFLMLMVENDGGLLQAEIQGCFKIFHIIQ